MDDNNDNPGDNPGGAGGAVAGDRLYPNPPMPPFPRANNLQRNPYMAMPERNPDLPPPRNRQADHIQRARERMMAIRRSTQVS